MQADNLKLVELVDRDRDGVIAFEDQRMLLYDADVLGMLRRELVEAVGLMVARQLLIHLGYADGYRDAQTLKAALVLTLTRLPSARLDKDRPPVGWYIPHQVALIQ